jgi:hypothetical protein
MMLSISKNMKHEYFFFKILTISIFIIFIDLDNVIAQDTINRFNINIHLNHYIPKKHDWFHSYSPINPGIEILYKIPLNRKMSISAGTNYVYNLWELINGSSKWKRSAHELSFPLLLEHSLGHKTFITFGSYAVWLIRGKQLNINKFTTHWIDQTDRTDYNASSRFTFDMYLGLGIRQKFATRHGVLLTPFVKYRIKDYWMDEVQAKTSFGLMISFN